MTACHTRQHLPTKVFARRPIELMTMKCGCGEFVVESKIKSAAGFRLMLAAPGFFMQQRGVWGGEARCIGAISSTNAAAHAEGIDLRALSRFAAHATERARPRAQRRA
jgi:hypothetical protein